MILNPEPETSSIADVTNLPQSILPANFCPPLDTHSQSEITSGSQMHGDVQENNPCLQGTEVCRRHVTIAEHSDDKSDVNKPRPARK